MAIGDGWVDNAWVDAGWVVGAWATGVVPEVGKPRGSVSIIRGFKSVTMAPVIKGVGGDGTDLA